MDFSSDKIRMMLCSGLFFLFPLGMASIRHYSSVIFVVMVLCGLWCFFMDRERLSLSHLWIVCAFLVFISVISLSLLNAEDLNQGFKILGKMAYVVALAPLYAFVKKDASCALNGFLWGLVLAGPLNLIVALYSLYVQNLPRGKGYYNPIIFGDLMMLGALLLAAFMLSGFFKGRFSFLVAGISVVSFLLSSYLSGTRGAWVALPIVLLMSLGLFRQRLNWRKITQILILFCLFIVIVFSVTKSGKRISSRSLDLAGTTKNVLLFTQGESSSNGVGQRFVMWGVAFDMFKANPLLGAGLGGFERETEKQIAAKKVALWKVWPHAHSIYFEFLGTTGLMGFLAMIASLFIVPGIVFWKSLSGSELQRLSASAGLIFLTCFGVFGLTECWLYRSPMLISYIVCLSIFASGCLEKEVA